MSDEWDFYICRVDDAPASVFVDLGICDEVPFEGLPDLVWLRVPMLRPREDGLSSREEFDALVAIEDALERVVDENSASLRYVGRCTGGGTRDFFGYASDATTALGLLAEAVGSFPDYDIEMGSKNDPEGSVYHDFLHPDERAMQTIQNGRVLAVLEENGDQPEVERPIRHWIYFPAEDARGRFVAAAEALGFTVEGLTSSDDGDPHFGVQLEKLGATTRSAINDVTLDLFDLAKEHGGDYDGWETRIEKDPT